MKRAPIAFDIIHSGGGDISADWGTGRVGPVVIKSPQIVVLVENLLFHHNAVVEGHAPRPRNETVLSDKLATDKRGSEGRPPCSGVSHQRSMPAQSVSKFQTSPADAAISADLCSSARENFGVGASLRRGQDQVLALE